MKKCIQFSLFTLLISFGLNVLSMEEPERVTIGTVVNQHHTAEEQRFQELQNSQTILSNRLKDEESLQRPGQRYSHWTYHPNTSTVTPPIDLEEKNKEIKDSRGVLNSIAKRFSDWWNGLGIKNKLSKVSESNADNHESNYQIFGTDATKADELKNDFQNLDDINKLDVINDFVKKEKDRLAEKNKKLKSFYANQQYKFKKDFPNDQTLLLPFQNAELEAATILRERFNTRLNNFRKQINELLRNRHLKYNFKSGKFTLHEGQSEEPKEPSNDDKIDPVIPNNNFEAPSSSLLTPQPRRQL